LRLEKVQKRFVKLLSDVRGSTYEERIAEADLLTLKERRCRGDIIETFKTMKGINQVNKNEWFEIREDDNVRSTRANIRIENETETRRSDIIYKERSRLEIRKNFYTSRVAREWNRLPEWIKDRKTTNSFKNALDRWRANGGKFELTEDETNSNENNQPE
jgi:ribonuclease P/MRP protein subunit RPP40